MEQVQLWKEILSRGIVIRTCAPPSRYTKANMNELAVGCPVVLFMMLGHQESQQKSEWSIEAWGEKKRRGREERAPHGQRCPAWIEAVTKPHPKDPSRQVTVCYRLNEERAAVVRQMFDLARQGWGHYRIRNWLEESGVAPWGHASSWANSTIQWILRARETVGEYQPERRDDDGKRVPDGPPVPGYYPAAVKERVFRDVQAARRARRHKGGRRGGGGQSGECDTNLFTHLVFDDITRMPMHCVNRMGSKNKSGRPRRTYRYLNTERQRAGVPYRAFERGVLFSIIAKLKARDVDGRHEADALTARVDTLRQERRYLKEDYDDWDRQMTELPPSKRPKRGVARLAELEELIEQKDEELRQAEEKANTSGRTDALTDLKTSVQLLDEVEGNPREAIVRQRIKTRLPLLVESIWVRVQRIDKSRRYVHVRVYLHGGEPRYYPIPCGDLSGHAPWPLDDVDFRAGDKGGDAIAAEGSPELDA
jgi:hypothetical protein